MFGWPALRTIAFWVLYIHIYDEKFVLKLYVKKFLSSPTVIEPMSPDCRYGCFTITNQVSNQHHMCHLRPYSLVVKQLYRQLGVMGSIPIGELRHFPR